MYFCPVCDKETWPSGDGCEHANFAEPVTLIRCPFCSGPPAPVHHERDIPADPARSTSAFKLIEAYVFCHECGAQSPKADGFADDAEEAAEILPAIMRRAILFWQTRNERHKDLYEANAKHGNNLYPRPDKQNAQSRGSGGLGE